MNVNESYNLRLAVAIRNKEEASSLTHDNTSYTFHGLGSDF